MFLIIVFIISMATAQLNENATQDLTIDFNSPFSSIYDRRIWNPISGPLSGMGSDACRYLRYLIILQRIVDFEDIKSIVEVGFGDFQMNQHIIFEGKSYHGFDVVKSIKRQSEYNVEFTILQNLKEVERGGDLLITKDVMQHWPNSAVQYLMKNILPTFKYALLTNDMTPQLNRNDIVAGGHSRIPYKFVQGMEELFRVKQQDGTIKCSFLYTNPNKTIHQ